MAIHFLNADGSLKSIEYKGLVLKIRKGVSVRIMSDVWGYEDDALVWNKETKSPVWRTIRTCDYDWDTKSFAEVDATKAVKAAYRKYLINQEFNDMLARAEGIANRIEKGCMIEVVRGRKVKKGTAGKVVVMIEQPSGYGYRRSVATKLGVATSDVMIDTIGRNGKPYKNYRDMVWVWAYNCARTDVPQIDDKELMKSAVEKVDADLARA